MKTPYFNDTDAPLIIGGITILPGQTGDLPAHLVPQKTATTPADDSNTVLVEVLLGKASDVAPLLSDLSKEGLIELEALEKAGKNRKGVLQAISGELLSREDDPDTAAHEAREQRLNELGELTIEQLQSLKTNAAADDIALIDHAIALKEAAE